MSNELRQWLQAELKQRKLSHRAFAEQIDLSHSFVSKVINGEKEPSMNFCHKVAIAFDIPPTQVLQKAGMLPESPTDTPGPVTLEIMRLVEQLPVEKRNQVLEYIRFISQ